MTNYMMWHFWTSKVMKVVKVQKSARLFKIYLRSENSNCLVKHYGAVFCYHV